LLAYFCVEHITEFPGNPLVGSSEDVIPNTLLIPDVVVTKNCVNPDGLPVGVPADFEVVVTNTGETDLSCVAAELNNGAPILLASGEDFSETVPVDTIGECLEDRIVSNEVTVICSVPGAQTPTTVQDSADDTCPVLCETNITASKTCDNPDGLPQGVPADFTITVNNVGDTEVDCTDSAGEIGTITLAPGASDSIPYSASTAGECLEDALVSNATLITCTDTGGSGSDEASVSDSCPVTCEPCMEAIKVCDNPNGLPVGVPADFTITVENCGDLPIICDDSEGEIGTIPLDPGQSASVPYSASTDDACLNEPYEVSNTTLVTCTASDGTPLESPVSDACDVLCEPCIEVEKDCAETELILEGEPADFNIVIRNCGDIPLEDISITDPAVGPVDPYAGPLGPGEASDPIMVTIDAAQCVDGVVENAVAVSAETPQGQVTDTATDVCPCGTPCVDVEKVCTSTELVVPGGPAAFDIIITNCGDVPLEVISIDDPAVGPVLPAGPLVPGESETVSVVIDEALCVDTDNGFEVENTVTVTSEGETDTATDVCPCEEETGGEGCTPGFWKQKNNRDYPEDSCWCDTYKSNPNLTEVYSEAALAAIPHVSARKEKNSAGFTEETLDDALDFQGGGDLEGAVRKLLRHGTAALLNACTLNGGGNYPESASTIISDINAAIATQDIETIDNLKNSYGNWNECLPCTMNANCMDIDIEDAEEPEIQCTDDNN
jgi:hypothetical protein